ncbi:hypothetical protein B0H16DRAFT_310612 [Mycena metata]|uniref:Uncharacterized protein n=1 Tax=Mycena metata TaxID=1033252 RepID=A0AAD7JQQ6_9AGAR|nr:hypothetical protein B0H16DRAFT_310612 [Mycena metata]
MDPSPELDRLPSLSSLPFSLSPGITIPSEHSAYVGFKHRLWVTWYLKRSLKGTVGRSWAQDWWWEDEDEHHLEGFARSKFTPMTMTGSGLDWAGACSAFEAHRSQSTTFVNPSKLDDLIGAWGSFLSDSLSSWFEACQSCGISRFLKIWLETMREVYPLEDLQWIPWEHHCGCFTRQVQFLYRIPLFTPLDRALRSLPLGAPRVNLAKTSPIPRALYRLVVPTWPLTLWMAFRASNDINVPKFLNILQDSVHRDVILNDSDDYVSASWEIWTDYAVEMDLRIWAQIRNMVCKRPRRAFHRDARVAVACLIFSPSPESVFSRPVLQELGISDYPFDTVTLVVSKHYEPRSNSAQFASKEFWTNQNLENWIETRHLDFCHAVWQTSYLGVSERLSIILKTLKDQIWAPQKNLLFHIYCLTSRTVSNSSSDVLEKLLEALTNPIKESDVIHFLANYSSNFDAIFTVLKKSVEVRFKGLLQS